MLEPFKNQKDARVIFYRLTELAKPVAAEHHHHHQHTLEIYEKIANQYTPNEQATIQKFLETLVGEIGK